MYAEHHTFSKYVVNVGVMLIGIKHMVAGGGRLGFGSITFPAAISREISRLAAMPVLAHGMQYPFLNLVLPAVRRTAAKIATFC